MNYGARSYDPALGTFISPDSLVPNPRRIVDHNRFLYARGNPLKYSDPSRYIPDKPAGPTVKGSPWEEEFYWNNRWYLAHDYGWDGNHWSKPIQAQFLDREILIDVLTEAGVVLEGPWKEQDPESRNLSLFGQGLVALAQKIGGLAGASTTAGLAYLETASGGGMTWQRWPLLERPCPGVSGCVARSQPSKINFNIWPFYLLLPSALRGLPVHETAHVFHPNCTHSSGNCVQELESQAKAFQTEKVPVILGGDMHGPYEMVDRYLTKYAMEGEPAEYWAEAVTVWVYESAYPSAPHSIGCGFYIGEIYSWVEGFLLGQ